ncbi:MAG: DUF4861 family protein [Verrucomicrobia bacterium]|nr:DUF4861 family protein [Verrucomicrobiota bacterium]
MPRPTFRLPRARVVVASLAVFAELLGLMPSLSAQPATQAPVPSATTAVTDRAPATGCRFVPERMDDFAWENDQVAFRTYGPALRANPEDSGIDCWLKRVPYPILDLWYSGEKRGVSYHQDHGEGYDPYHVGSSRGCGGLALWRDEKMVLSDTYVAWRVIERSPERSVFELDYLYPATSGEAPIAETKRISIRLGEPFCRIEASFTRGGQAVADLAIAIGITTHDGKAKPTFDPQKRWMSCWEVIDKSGLGTGVVLGGSFKAAKLIEIKPQGPDTGHVLMITQTNASGVLSYWAGYGWEKAARYKTSADWEKALQNKAK